MKKISVFLSVALLFSMLFTFLTSCGGNEGGENTDENPAEAQGSHIDGDTVAGTDETATETEKISADVPDDKDYEGYEFKILANSVAYNTHWFSRDIDTEEETGETINDAVYTRNRTIEEKYNNT